MTSQPFDFDGLVIEGANGVRLVAIPTSILQVLADAEVIQFQRGGQVSRMRVSNFLDLRDTMAPPVVEDLQPVPAPAPAAAERPGPSSSAPTPEYGAPALPISSPRNPSPTPPPVVELEEEDPADIPVRAKRGGEWVTIYLTRTQYEQHVQAGRITPALPQQVRGVDGATEGA